MDAAAREYRGTVGSGHLTGALRAVVRAATQPRTTAALAVSLFEHDETRFRVLENRTTVETTAALEPSRGGSEMQ